ncbi:MAG: hypothetical protein DRH90_20960 [Deltaproteobacteria bacterium]|nr:MAG: hypothetical protein DRH90_20960 [Deltaproteobacteria bacterium]
MIYDGLPNLIAVCRSEICLCIAVFLKVRCTRRINVLEAGIARCQLRLLQFTQLVVTNYPKNVEIFSINWVTKPALKHVLTLLYVSYGFEDRKIFFFAKKGRQPNSDLIGLAWINL